MAQQKVRGLTASRPVPEEWVVMEHPGIDGTQRCAPSAVEHWEERGWSVVEAAPAPEATPEVAAAEQPAAAEPAPAPEQPAAEPAAKKARGAGTES